jgi:hypothetical protein
MASAENDDRLEDEIRDARPRGPQSLLDRLAASVGPRRVGSGLARRGAVLGTALVVLASLGAAGYAGALGGSAAKTVKVSVLEQRIDTVAIRQVRNSAAAEYLTRTLIDLVPTSQQSAVRPVIPAGTTVDGAFDALKKAGDDARDARQAAELAACRANPRCNVASLRNKHDGEDRTAATNFATIKTKADTLTSGSALASILASHYQQRALLADGQAARRTFCARTANRNKAQCKNLATREVSERLRLATLQRAELDAFLGL